MFSLKEKNKWATDEPFVFFEMKKECAKFDGEEYLVFEKAIRVKNEGNDEFKTGDFEKAIQAYGEAITLLRTLDAAKCGRELAICYQNRAAANEKLLNIALMIDDATMAIGADKTYAEGYFRRARGYIIKRKFYSAMQDIVWACIFDRFRTEEYRKLAANLNSRFELRSSDAIAAEADDEIKYCDRRYSVRNRSQLEHLIDSTILDDILVPIGGKSTATGYLRAMKGLKEFNLTEIRAGCVEEIASKGQYWVEGRILLAYMTAFGSPSTEYVKDIDDLFKLMANATMSQKLANNIKLCLGNTLMEVFDLAIRFREYGKARDSYAEAIRVLNRVAKGYEGKHKIYLVKSGVLQRLLTSDADAILICSKNQCLADLDKCCKLMPNYYQPHYQRATLCTTISRFQPNPSIGLDQLYERFPNEIVVLNNVIPSWCAKGQHEKAKFELNKFRLHNPEKIEETWLAEGMAHAGHPASVEYLRRFAIYKPYTNEPYNLLANYFDQKSHEYGKVLEVLNKCLEHIMYCEGFATAFKWRQKLLSTIVAENYWDRL